jgi:hypothetical protein
MFIIISQGTRAVFIIFIIWSLYAPHVTSAIETADVNKAFNRCLINYKKNKYSHNKTLNISIDKKLFREEVEGALDSLLLHLNKKEEHELMEEVVGVMKRLEVIFYG